jgi:hypothetical protein
MTRAGVTRLLLSLCLAVCIPACMAAPCGAEDNPQKPNAVADPVAQPAQTSEPRFNRADALFWESVRNSKNAADIKAYLTQFPRGVFVELARSRLAELESRPASQAAPALSPPPAARVPLKDAVTARLAATSGLSAGVVDGPVQSYVALKEGHKAIAAATVAPFTISSAAGLTTTTEAGITALERCQIVQRAPCTLIAVDNGLPPVPADGKWPLPNMPRVNFEGTFDPGWIPGVTPEDRARADVAGYLRAPAPKAAALTAGKITIVSGAASQFEAERQALAACGSGCYLYAAGNRVVFSQHRTEPRAHGKSLGDVISYTWASDEGPKLASSFEQAKAHKSLAMLPETGRPFTFSGLPSGELAEEVALEACELQFNAPCVAVALDGKVLTPDPSSGARRTMPRITYQGSYRPEMVPLFPIPTKEMRDYATLSGPKAMAIRAAGPKLKVGTARTLAAAEAKALAECNDESPYPCILYAANERVILPQRRTEPEP